MMVFFIPGRSFTLKRRMLLKTTVTAGLFGLGGALGWSGLNSPSESAFQSLREVSSFLKSLPSQASITSTGDWQPIQIFKHIRQSLIYSMQGFPQMKSELFQSTLGSLAYHLFSAKGAMTHSLSEPIPGAENLSAEGSVQQEIRLLIEDIEKFLSLNKLYPHFAFGNLTPEQYQLAQLFHINDHFTELKFS